MRFITPTLFLLAGFWIAWTNGAHTDRVVTLPFMDVFSDNVQEQGRMTAIVCWSIGGFTLVWDLVGFFRKKGPEA